MKTDMNIPAPENGGSKWASASSGLEAQGGKAVYLHPGQTFASKEPATISMILGSCVGVCLFDRMRSMGGATHYILPKWDGTGQPSSRYGNVAIKALLEQLQVQGSKPRDLRAMVFGGACMFQSFRGERTGHIGTNNVTLAMETLAELGIEVVSKNVGGEKGRKLKMQTNTGLVMMTLIGEK